MSGVTNRLIEAANRAQSGDAAGAGEIWMRSTNTMKQRYNS